MQTDRNATLRTDPYELPVLRTSSLAGLRDCPRRWASENTVPVGEDAVEVDDEGGSEYARRGTAVHNVCDRVLNGDLDPTDVEVWEPWDRHLKRAGVPPQERQNALDYCCDLWERLRSDKWKLVAVEARFVRAMVPGAPPVKGTPDAIWMDLEEGCYVIQDHKTNRRWEHSDEWRRKVQPRIYTWAIRQALERSGLSPRIDFEIGYVNLGGTVRWTTTLEEDLAVVAEVSDLWEELKVYRRTGEWPERVNDWCSSCPLLYGCNGVVRLMESVAGLDGLAMDGSREDVTLDDLNRVKAAIKVAEALEERMAAQVRARVQCAGGQLREGNWTALLRPRSKREAMFSITHHLWNEVEVSQQESEAMDEAQDDVFSVRLGALDKVIKRVPRLGRALSEADAIETLDQEPQLVIRLAKPGE